MGFFTPAPRPFCSPCSIIDSYKERAQDLHKQNAQRRFDEYWQTHQSEKVELESEKKSLTEQIAAINESIETIPQNTEGYAEMVELQKKVENLTAEKNAHGAFKFKEKKAVQGQIDSTKNEIKPIQARIDSAIEEAKNRIPPLESRIEEIDTELTKPR